MHGNRSSHVGVIRPAGTLRCHPGDILRRVFDVAGFAVHTVLGIDLKAFAAGFLNNLIHAGGTIALSRLIVQGQVFLNWDAGVSQF